MPQVIIPALTTALTPALGATLATVVGYGLYIGASYLALQALSPKSNAGRGLTTNFRAPDAPHDFVYGRVRKGGPITFMESSGTDNKYLHMVICLAGHEVHAIDTIYINDEPVGIDVNNFVTTPDWVAEDGTKLIRIKKYLGSTTQTYDTQLENETSVTSAFAGRGIAYIYVRMQYDGNVFSGGIPTFTAVVRGKKVYDPRTSTTGYSANAALCVRDYITSEYGLNDSNVDDTYFSSAANTCDEFVSLVGGSGTEKRYEINGVVQASETPKQILDKMMTACGGTLYWSGGQWRLRVAEYNTPIRSLDLNDVVSSIQVQTRVNRRDSFNSVEGTFVDASDDWIVTDYPKISSATFLNEDNGVDNVFDFQLPLTTSAPMAQRLAKILLYRTREQIQFEADFNMNAYDLEIGDVVQFTNPRYGWTNKEFEVRSWRFFADQDAGDLRVRMILRETSSAVYDWNAEEREIISNNSILPKYSDGVGITPVTVDDVTITKDGTILLIKDEGVSTDKVAPLAITTAKIGNAAITNAKIGDLQVDSAKIDDLAIGNIKIQDLATANSRFFSANITDPGNIFGDSYSWQLPFDHDGDAIFNFSFLMLGGYSSSSNVNLRVDYDLFGSSFFDINLGGTGGGGVHSLNARLSGVSGGNIVFMRAYVTTTNVTNPSCLFSTAIIQRYK